MKRKRYFVISVDMFRVDVGVAIGMTEAEVERKIRADCTDKAIIKEWIPELRTWNSASALGRMTLFGGGFVVLLRDDDIGVIVHEMVHVAQYLLRNRRIPLSEDTEEVHAYLTEHLVVETLEALRE